MLALGTLLAPGERGPALRGLLCPLWDHSENGMKRKLLGMPLIAIALMVAIPLVALAAYTIITITGQVTVQEAITVSPATFSANIYPGETFSQTLTLNNASNVNIDVSFISSITPVTTEVTLSAPNKITVPSLGSTLTNITITASKSAPPAIYTISLALTR